jgi:hypothetical protein
LLSNHEKKKGHIQPDFLLQVIHRLMSQQKSNIGFELLQFLLCFLINTPTYPKFSLPKSLLIVLVSGGQPHGLPKEMPILRQTANLQQMPILRQLQA